CTRRSLDKPLCQSGPADAQILPLTQTSARRRSSGHAPLGTAALDVSEQEGSVRSWPCHPSRRRGRLRQVVALPPLSEEGKAPSGRGPATPLGGGESSVRSWPCHPSVHRWEARLALFHERAAHVRRPFHPDLSPSGGEGNGS